MSQTILKIHNPTGGRVAYLGREARITAPPGTSHHALPTGKVAAIKAHFAKHHPLLALEASAPEALEVPEPPAVPEKPARKTSRRTSKAKGKAAGDDQTPTDTEAQGE